MLVDWVSLTGAFVISGVFLVGVCGVLAILAARRPDLRFDEGARRRE